MKEKTNFKTYPITADKVGFLLGLADNTLILGQRLSELTGHGPTLEVDMACANIALDLFGEVRNYYQYIAEIKGNEITEDDLAFMRTEREYRNALLVEQPNRDFAYTIARQFLYDQFHFLLLEKLKQSEDFQLAAIAQKSIKEVTYHRDFSADWIKRLRDGTEESHQRMQTALSDLWKYHRELFEKTPADEQMITQGIGVDYDELKDTYYQNVREVVEEATLNLPELKYFQSGGKMGKHTEHMGHLLTEMQYMQRTYPGMEW